MGDLELQVFADRLKELRTSSRLTQAEFVKDLGITPAALSAYENNQKNPSISVAKRIAEKYGVSIDWLCGLSEKRRNSTELETYADLIRIILTITHESGLPFPNYWDVSCAQGYDDLSCKACSSVRLSAYDDTLYEFFKAWNQMSELLKDGTIDKYLYDLWLNDRLKEYEHLSLKAPFN